jgi:hypothetical protein
MREIVDVGSRIRFDKLYSINPELDHKDLTKEEIAELEKRKKIEEELYDSN